MDHHHHHHHHEIIEFDEFFPVFQESQKKSNCKFIIHIHTMRNEF